MTKLFLTLFDLYGVTRDSLRVSGYPTKDQMPLPFFAASRVDGKLLEIFGYLVKYP